MANWLTNLFSKSSPNSSNNLGNLVQTGVQIAAAANPQVAAVVNGLGGLNSVGQILPSANVAQSTAPIAPTAAQLETAKQALDMAQLNYNTLLNQVKAVQAYNAIMQQIQTDQAPKS